MLPEVIMKKKILIMIITAITVLSLTGICASAGVFGPLDFGDFGGGGDSRNECPDSDSRIGAETHGKLQGA